MGEFYPSIPYKKARDKFLGLISVGFTRPLNPWKRVGLHRCRSGAFSTSGLMAENSGTDACGARRMLLLYDPYVLRCRFYAVACLLSTLVHGRVVLRRYGFSWLSG